MTAASPGVIAHFLRNEYYPSREAYLAHLTDIMKDEYDAVVQAGFILQLDCPDLGMGRHLAFPDLSTGDFVKIAEAQRGSAQSRAAGYPARPACAYICAGAITKGPTTATSRSRRSSALCSRHDAQAVSFEGANPRHEHEWTVFRDVRLPEGKVIIPGVLDSTTNFIEHPELVAQRLVRYAELVGKENVIAGSDCGFGTAPGPITRWNQRSSGPSYRPWLRAPSWRPKRYGSKGEMCPQPRALAKDSAPGVCPSDKVLSVCARQIYTSSLVYGIRGSTTLTRPLTSGLKECQQVGVELILVRVGQAVGCAWIDLQRRVLDEFR